MALFVKVLLCKALLLWLYWVAHGGHQQESWGVVTGREQCALDKGTANLWCHVLSCSLFSFACHFSYLCQVCYDFYLVCFDGITQNDKTNFDEGCGKGGA